MTQDAFDFEAAQAGPGAGTLNFMILALLKFNPRWFMPWELCEAMQKLYDLRISDSSCTARLRDLRKPQYGAHNIEKRRREGSTAFEYRLNDREEA